MLPAHCSDHTTIMISGFDLKHRALAFHSNYYHKMHLFELGASWDRERDGRTTALLNAPLLQFGA